MKITSTGIVALPPAAPAAETPAAGTATTTAAPTQRDAAEPASHVLHSAQAALRAMPEIDAAKVAQLREALARGEVRFDAGKLAGLIARYHGVRE